LTRIRIPNPIESSLSPQYLELVAQGEVLEDQRSPGLETRQQEA
jgi:hypothetical protein